MKKLYIILFVVYGLFLLTACSSTKSFFYYEPPRSFTFNKPYDKVWNAAVNLVAERNYVITNIDKDCGIITLQSSLFKAAPQNKGRQDNDFYYAVQRYRKCKDKKLYVVSHWNIHIRDIGNGLTEVSVNLLDNGEVVAFDKKDRQEHYRLHNRSTGTFEKKIIYEIMDELRQRNIGRIRQ